MKTRIHVNQHIIKRNAKTGKREPALTVKDYRRNRRASSVTINGPSQVVYSPDKPLPCGARCWIETEAEVITDSVCRSGKRCTKRRSQ
jgi:hypothetical protein